MSGRPLAWLAALLVPGLMACVAPGPEEAERSAFALGNEPIAAGISAGSLTEEGVLLLVNDRDWTGPDFVGAGLTPDLATAIVACRSSTQGPRWFRTLDELDALAGTDAAAFAKLVAAATSSGHVEAPDFGPADQARLSVPDGLNHPPTSLDVTVEAGFDGATPETVAALVRARLTNTVHSSNESFIHATALATHKSFTIGVGNFFAPGSPPAVFAASLAADRLTMLGTASAVNPTILVAERAGATTYYARTNGAYAPIPKPAYPILMRARVRLSPPGVRVFYPAWSAPVLAGPTSVIHEGSG